MIIRNKVIVSAKYLLDPISPEGEDYFPSIEGFISCRQATFSKYCCPLKLRASRARVCMHM